MVRIDRRRLLKLSGAGAAAAASGGLAGILASGRAPAYAQETTLHWVRWSDFVPASDKVLREKILPEGQKALGIKIHFETINANDIQARVTAAIQSATAPTSSWRSTTGRSSTPRVSPMSAMWPRRSAKHRAAITTSAKAVGTYQGKWIGVPWAIGGGLVAYRKSWLARRRLPKIPGNLGRMARRRKEAQGRRSSDRADLTSHLWRRARILVPILLVLGRQRSRDRRQNRRAQQQGDDRFC